MNQTMPSELKGRAWQAMAGVVGAHLIMLRDVEILDDSALETLLAAVENVRNSLPSDQSLQELVAEFDERVDSNVAQEVRGAALVGRGLADVLATVVRLIVREDLLTLAWSLNQARAAFLDLADAHVVSIIPAYAGGQPAQPTTFAHLLGGVISPLARVTKILVDVYHAVDQSPMSSVSLASTGLEIDPGRTAVLLGFARIMDNAFDAVSAVDHVAGALHTARGAVQPIARFLDELRVWERTQLDALQFDENHVRSDTSLPQFASAGSLQNLASEAENILRLASSAHGAVETFPYGPVFGPDHDTLLSASTVLSHATWFLEQCTDFVSNQLRINRAVLANRAGKGMITSSDLADFLMLEEQLPPFAARAIAHRTIAAAREQGREASGITPEFIDSAALLVLGRELRVEFEAISRYLAPRRFIERRGLAGGPAPATMRAYLEHARNELAQDQQWQADIAARVAESMRSLAVASATSVD